MLLVAQDCQCRQGKDMHKASKEHYQEDEKIQQLFDDCLEIKKISTVYKKSWLTCCTFGQKHIDLSTF